ncbi:MAG: threonine synthase [Eubacteriales bacterium]|nr:threonine synthase [Eubacteriales bacterium]MDD4078764.1 threonine synthase [Eubacteriales bacterium]MDD4769402.1 threonine synthase [Eubacteriales bacterium]
MRYVIDLECIKCGNQYSPEPDRYLCTCGGLLEVRYDYPLLRQEWDRDALADNSDYSMWRYLPLLPVGPFSRRSPLRTGWTPLYKSSALARALGLKGTVWVKDDGLNPTGSLKDRASAVAVVKAAEAGAKIVACSSTGNAASSLAGNVASLGGSMQSVIFVPARAPQGKVAQLLIYGAKVISVQGSYRDAFELSAAAIERWGWYNRNAAINPYLVEGKKTVVLELAEQLDWQMPDWLVLSVGDGCTIAGAGKGLQDLKELGFIDKVPRLLGVQASGCAPIFHSYCSGSELIPAEENTLADSIAVGVPRNPHKAMCQVRHSQGVMVAVEDEEILAAMRLMGRTCGVFAEPASAAGLAGLARAVKEGLVEPDSEVAVISTGNGLKDIANALKAAGEPLRVAPDIDQLAQVLGEG